MKGTTLQDAPATLPGSWPVGRMRALVFTAPSELEWQEVDIPHPVAGTVLARVSHVGICGTDLHLFDGSSAYVRRGLTAYPMRPGHEWCGTVVAVGEGVTWPRIGERVVGEPFLSCGRCSTCRTGHTNLCPFRSELGVRGNEHPGAAAEYVRIPSSNLTVVPDSVSSEHALLAEPSVTVLHSLASARLQPGDRLAVIGSGTLGLIAVQVAAAQGCAVDVIGVDMIGLALAERCGARATFAPGEAEADQYDVVLEASGAATALAEASRIAGIGGRISQTGIPGTDSVPVDAAAFVSKGLQMAGILGGIPFLHNAMALIARGVIDPGVLIDTVYPHGEAGVAMAAMATPGRPRPKIILDLLPLTTEVKP